MTGDEMNFFGRLSDGLITFLCFIPLLTFHEFAHAWVAWKCGDDTSKKLGRITLNPIAHMEVLGTVILPLLGILLGVMGSGLASFIIGWGKPVPVNLGRLKRPRVDDVLVSLAGPAMNLLLAIVLLIMVKVALLFGAQSVAEIGVRMAMLSLFLCFFNLLPVPPLDGSHVLKNLIGMSHETYLRISQWGFMMVIILIQIPAVRIAISVATEETFIFIASILRVGNK